ncbi:MAG: hypothetical protein SLAVMIC_00184 [uncultured marine phage]|uniref:Uncharacterized protein n=1 Tax=uncultured marine phage TaxID=707152 RepID=A0A8D9C9J7_9VIRU|nr:MAG: hypothetical protein SLAVMIC_00184 [uncultured marine phage]
MEFDNIINKDLQEENTELSKKVEKSLGRIEYYELEISGKKIGKKFKKYSKLYDKMVELHVKMNFAKSELEGKLNDVDESVKTIQTISQIKRFVSEGDTVLKSNAKLAKNTYSKALELSQELLGIELIGKSDIDYIQEKIDIAKTIQTTEQTKTIMSYVSSFLSDGNERILGLAISKIKDLNFTKVNAFEKDLIQKMVTKVLFNHSDKLGSLVDNIKSNPTAIKMKLEINIPLFN